MEVQFYIRYKRPDGTIVSREATVLPNSSDRNKSQFIARARRQINGALRSVLGASPDLKIEKEG